MNVMLSIFVSVVVSMEGYLALTAQCLLVFHSCLERKALEADFVCLPFSLCSSSVLV